MCSCLCKMLINYKIKYPVFIVLILTGYFLLYNYSKTLVSPKNISPCIFKNLTGIPCPSCGSTRATVQLIQGQFWNSILINPLSLITNVLIVLSSFWMAFDLIRQKESFFPFLKKDWNKWLKIGLLILVLANWVWNIQKGL